MVRLYIIRHGDPDYDTDKANGGSLTEHGKSEARALSHILSQEGITHAYSSPLGRAKLTAQLALEGIPKFSTKFYVDREIMPSIEGGDSEHDLQQQQCLNNFEANVQIEDWCRELSTWRQSTHLGDFQGEHPKTNKPPAIWDFPAPIIRSQLHDMVDGDRESKGWKDLCLDYKVYQEEYATFKKEADEFLSRHGILKGAGAHSNSYVLSKELASAPENRQLRIAIFCHGGMGLTLLSHLLSIPLPLVHGSMWLAPSSVSTILFDEHQTSAADHIIVTPRAIQIGGTHHLTAAGLETSYSIYEGNKRPAGVKHNYW